MKKKRTRKYNAQNRDAQSLEAKERVLSLAIKLLVRYKDQFSLRKLAKEAHCSERHLYRLFQGIEGLSKELNSKMNSLLNLEMDMDKLTFNQLPKYARDLFSKFNEREDLVDAYLVSPLGLSSRKIWLDEKNAKIRKQITNDGGTEIAAKEVSILLSATFWQLVRNEVGMSADESLTYIAEMAEQLVSKFKMKR